MLPPGECSELCCGYLFIDGDTPRLRFLDFDHQHRIIFKVLNFRRSCCQKFLNFSILYFASYQILSYKQINIIISLIKAYNHISKACHIFLLE